MKAVTLKQLDSPVSYFGSKKRFADQIIKYFPKFNSINCYCEIFGGSLSIYWRLLPKVAILNDYNHFIYSFWKAMQYYYDKLKWELKHTLFGHKWFEEFQNKIFNPEVEYTDEEIIINKAIYFYMVTSMNFASIFKENIKSLTYRIPCIPLKEDFDKYNKILRRDLSKVSIWNLDFREALNRINKWNETKRNKYVLYLDPPYYLEGKGYEMSFSEQDHLDLFEELSNSEHLWFLSYDDHEFIRKLYKDFHITEISIYYTASNTNNKRNLKNELLISNKPLKENKKETTLTSFF